MLNFWNLPKMLRPKIWPKEGQNFTKKKGYQVATYQNSVHGGLYVSEIVLIGVWTVAKNTE